MYLHRVTPDPFENSKLETSAIGQGVDRWGIRDNALIAKFDRFGNGARRSDFELEITWSDMEQLIERFRQARHSGAIELESALRLAKAAKGAGWTAPPQNC